MEDGLALKIEWIALIVSGIAYIYYTIIQDFLDVNSIVVVLWTVLNLALVYRVVASLRQPTAG